MSDSSEETTIWYWNQQLGRTSPRPPLTKARLRELRSLHRRGLIEGLNTVHPSMAGFEPVTGEDDR